MKTVLQSFATEARLINFFPNIVRVIRHLKAIVIQGYESLQYYNININNTIILLQQYNIIIYSNNTILILQSLQGFES
jgi:hypothetical protein